MSDASDRDDAISDKAVSDDLLSKNSFDETPESSSDEMEKLIQWRNETQKQIPGYYEYQKFVTGLVEGIEYDDFSKENCEEEFIETYMLKAGTYYASLPRQKFGIKNGLDDHKTFHSIIESR